MIIRSNGILIVDSIPLHTPVDNEATLARLEDSFTWFYWNGAAWVQFDVPVASDTAYNATTWNGNTDVPTKNAIRDVLEALVVGILPDGDYGDVTVSGSGTVITIDADAITYAKIQDVSSTDRLLGRDTAGSGIIEELTVSGGIEFTGAGGIQRSAFAGGDVTAPAGSGVLTIANDSISYPKMQDVTATDRILGRVSSGAGVVEEIPFTDLAQSLAAASTVNAAQQTLDLEVGVDVQAYDPTLASLAIYNTNGILVQTSVNTFTGRTLTGTANEITVTNGNGVSGNPTLSLPTGINPTKLADGSVDATEFQYLSGVTSAIQTQLDAKAADADVVHDTGNETIAGVKTFTSDPIVPDEVYDATAWNANMEPPTKNAIRDKIESILTNLPAAVYKAVLAQTGTSNPTASYIVKNTIGEVPTLSRVGVGSYELGLVGTGFTTSKTIPLATLALGATAYKVEIEWTATNKVSFKTYDEAGVAVDLEGEVNLSIEVYI